MAPIAPSLSAPPEPVTAIMDKKVHPCKRFEAVYTVLLDYLMADFRKQNMPEEAIEYYRSVRTCLSRIILPSSLSFSAVPTGPTDYKL